MCHIADDAVKFQLVKAIHEVQKELNLTKVELSRILLINRQTLYEWEKYGVPSKNWYTLYAKLQRISQGLLDNELPMQGGVDTWTKINWYKSYLSMRT